ncbi:cellobiose phosphorylase [Pyrococcus woesei]|uniref:cellobiose phosphorylase n=1 Tax=Pyrococcus woesei TaxID=2262 RepID=UPI0019CC08A7|nr:cellobiose phosphorylase [Methanomassiliicoccales archaeon]
MRENFDSKGRFIIENYNRWKPFASFLPGIAGKKGIPMWVFYVNRGQCISSFGIQDKDHPIMEFNSAVRAYQNIRILGFRTFIKLSEEGVFYEPFTLQDSEEIRQRMYVGRNELEIEEIHERLGLSINVLYYTLPQEKIPALIRIVTIRNISSTPRKLEILDGMPIIIPYGVNDYVIKHMATLIKAWIEVFNLEKKMPFFKLKSSTEDVPKVTELTEGTFYISFVKRNGKSELVKPIVDPDVVFGDDTSMITPENFIKTPLRELLNRKQVTFNKIPSAFSPVEVELKANEEVKIHTVIGYVPHISILDHYGPKFADEKYLWTKYEEGNNIIEEIVSDIWTKTSSQLFDEYVKQCYLDNVLRGGYPIVLNEEKPFVYYLYLRKHGDQERDYNYFVLTPEYYSTGNGNYRDVNQNRRENVFFHPEIGNYDIRFFMSLIQADGYNPLVINGVKYHLVSEDTSFLEDLVDKPEVLSEALKEPFTPGRLLMFMEENNIKLKVSEEEFLRTLLKHCEEEIDAVHGEGYWCDHWTYNLDLIESYLGIYPDKKRELLFEDRSYTYYDNTMIVLPRSKRYVLENGKIRQYNSLIEDKEKKALIESRKKYKHVMRAEKGRGEIYRTTLATKLLNLALVKFATLDPAGVGIEMEAGKPGWYDALNGLPGLFGSSVGETAELLRLFNFLIEAFEEFPEAELDIPVEVWRLFTEEVKLVEEYNSREDENKDHWLWEALSDLREWYREETKLGFDGREVKVKARELVDSLKILREKLRVSLEKAIEENNGIMPMYFYYEPVEYELSENGEIRILKFEQRKMPLFLEGVVKQMKITKEKGLLKELYQKVKKSELYDKKLKMYKLNAPLKDCSIEIGRARAFTPGWLENESIWLHMEYKYMLELIRNGLYEEFYDDFRNVIVAFLDPTIYGRSPLENSSFIVSSAYPDESLHGRGFVARLTGANAEFLSIWKNMFIGDKPFTFENGELRLTFAPALPGWLFDEEGKVSFNFLGKCRVTYHNPAKKDTWKLDLNKAKIILHLEDGSRVEVNGNTLRGEHALMVREGRVREINIYLPEE